MSRWEMSTLCLDGSTVRTSPRAGYRFAQPAIGKIEKASSQSDVSPLTRMNLAQHDSGILAPEGDAVRYGVLEVHLARMPRDVIEVALRIRLVHVDRRRRHAVSHRQQCRSDARRAASSLGMTDQALQGRPGQFVSMAVEGKLGGAGFDAVVQLGRGAVIVDI